MSRDTFTFASIQRPSWRYRLYERWDDHGLTSRQMQYAMSNHIAQFDTMGDGEVQHCPDCPVQTTDTFDVLHSLRMSLDRLVPVWDGSELKYNEAFRAFWQHDVISDSSVELLYALKPSTWNKPVYWSLSEGKQSASDSKRHDKRWMETPRLDDGKDIKNSSNDKADFMLGAWNQCERHRSIIQAIGDTLKILKGDQWAVKRWLQHDNSVLKGCDMHDLIFHYKTIEGFWNSLHTMKWSVESIGRIRENERYLEELKSKEAAAANGELAAVV